MPSPSTDTAGRSAVRTRPPRWRRIVRVVAVVAFVALIVGEVAFIWPRLNQSISTLTDIHFGWLAACIAAQALSMSGYSRVQKQLLSVAGVRIKQRSSLAVIYAATAMSVTLPAGQVFSTAFTYRALRGWGATPLIASWELVTSGVIGAGGLAVLGVSGATLAGADTNGFGLVVTIVATISLLLTVRWASMHPDSVKAAARRVMGAINRILNRARDSGHDRIEETIAQLRTVRVKPLAAVQTVFWAITHRAGDLACLFLACWAVGEDPRWAGILIAYSVGKAVGSIPLAPGGLGFVDTALVAALTSTAGISAASAIAAALVYRGVSLVLVAAAGWTVVAFRFRNYKSDDRFAEEANGA